MYGCRPLHFFIITPESIRQEKNTRAFSFRKNVRLLEINKKENITAAEIKEERNPEC